MKTKTIAAVIHAKDAPFSLEEVELDEPRPNEVLVRMVATGLCHTDLSVRSGAIPFPLPGVVGHEGAGVVEAVGSAVQRVQPGDHVLASFTSCGSCPNCQAGHPVYCFSWFPLNLLEGSSADGSHTLEQNGMPLNALEPSPRLYSAFFLHATGSLSRTRPEGRQRLRSRNRG